MSRLMRFKSAQNAAEAGFASALDEIHSGGKQGHWIWYVFPQLSGLGMSAFSRTFGIDGEDEAIEYLRDSELRSRLLTITSAVAERLEGKALSLRALMGSEVDARKVVSSLTLFGNVAKKLHAKEGVDAYRQLAQAADDVLAAAAAEGYPPCAYTLRQLSPR
jgi:uncharacterized protein (DUF1810 family)